MRPKGLTAVTKAAMSLLAESMETCQYPEGMQVQCLKPLHQKEHIERAHKESSRRCEGRCWFSENTISAKWIWLCTWGCRNLGIWAFHDLGTNEKLAKIIQILLKVLAECIVFHKEAAELFVIFLYYFCFWKKVREWTNPLRKVEKISHATW